MKTLTVSLVAVFLAGNSLMAQRYIDEVFTDVVTEKNTVYSANITILYYPEFRIDTLRFDLYMPAGDTETARPLAVVLHNSSFLPRGLFAPTGDKDDYADVEICTRLAKRGYVAAAIQYRKGWNPVGPELERRATIIQAAYRSIQDVYAFLRFMNKTVQDGGNPYGVCMDKVALFGLGSGAFTSLNAAVLNSASDIYIDKYKDPLGNPFIDTTLIGDLHGIHPAGINIPNHVGYQDDFHFAFGFDGALGDISWLGAEDNIPIAAIGVVSHPTTPFGLNPITGEIDCERDVQGPVGPVVPVGGSLCLISKANDLCLNAELVASRYDDAISQAARMNPFASGEENIYPLILPGFQTGPWEYWDSTFWDMIPGPCATGFSIDDCSKLTNPDMSLEKANAYIDTAMFLFLPRAYSALNLDAESCENTFSCEGVEQDALIIDDYECQRPYTYGAGSDRLCIIDNPQKDQDNGSVLVGSYRDPANDPWAALCLEFDDLINYSISELLKFQINSPVAGPLLVKLEGGTSPAYEKWLDITAPGTWESFSLDLSHLIGMQHTRVCFFPNGGVSQGTEDVYLFDNINGLLPKGVSLFTSLVDPLDISPNPVSQTLYIRNPGNAQKFRMVNTLGQFVTEFTSSPGESLVSLAVDDLHTGVYLLGAYDDQGKLIGNARILKQ